MTASMRLRWPFTTSEPPQEVEMNVRNQARALLMPGIYQCGAERGLPFTDEEADAVVDAYVLAHEAGGPALPAAIAMLRKLTVLPLDLYRQQGCLARLRSVSAAWRAAQVPEPFRSLWVKP